MSCTHLWSSPTGNSFKIMSQGPHIAITITLSHFSGCGCPHSPSNRTSISIPGSAPTKSTESSRQRRYVGGGHFQTDSQAVTQKLTGWSGFRPASHSKKELDFGCQANCLFLQQHRAWGDGPPSPDFVCRFLTSHCLLSSWF